jgi:hypothetical protein
MERPLNVEFAGYLSNELNTHGLLKAVQEKIRALALTDIATVVRIDVVTGQPIVPVEKTVARLINVFRILRRCSLEVLSAKELAAVLEMALRVRSVFDRVQTYDVGLVTSVDAPGDVQAIIAQTDTVAAAAYETFGMIVTKTFYLGEFFTSQVDGASEHFSRIVSLSQEAKSTLSDIQKIAHAEVNKKFEDSFGREANDHKAASAGWTTGAVIFAALGIGYLWLSVRRLEHHLAAIPVAKLVTIEVVQVIAVSFVFYLMVLCGNNAILHRRNFIDSNRRRNMLISIKEILESTSGDVFHNDILVRAAAAVFDLPSRS